MTKERTKTERESENTEASGDQCGPFLSSRENREGQCVSYDGERFKMTPIVSPIVVTIGA